MGSPRFHELVRAIPYGKKLAAAVYLIPTDPSLLSKELLDTIRRAEVASRPDPGWNLLKLHTNESAISFLSYPDFDTDPHPTLAEATKINLNTGTVVRADYRGRSNPPILHRKETFLPPSDKRVIVFAELTQQEEKEGLYRDSSRIGLRMNWQALSGAPYDEQLEKLTELLHEKLWIRVQGESLDGMLAAAREHLEKKAENTAAHIHYEYGHHCGLINRRASRVNRYAPTDSLLKTLVLVNVCEPMEFSEFLAKLYERYRIVFGHVEANQAGLVGYEEAPFKKNRDRLEERLKSMGILKRLSDTVAYVENPAVTNL